MASWGGKTYGFKMTPISVASMPFELPFLSLYHCHYSWSQSVGGNTGVEKPWPSPFPVYWRTVALLFLLCHMKLPWSTWAAFTTSFSNMTNCSCSNHWHEWRRDCFMWRKEKGDAEKRQHQSHKKVRKKKHYYSVRHKHWVIFPHINIIGHWPRCGSAKDS